MFEKRSDKYSPFAKHLLKRLRSEPRLRKYPKVLLQDMIAKQLPRSKFIGREEPGYAYRVSRGSFLGDSGLAEMGNKLLFTGKMPPESRRTDLVWATPMASPLAQKGFLSNFNIPEVALQREGLPTSPGEVRRVKLPDWINPDVHAMDSNPRSALFQHLSDRIRAKWDQRQPFSKYTPTPIKWTDTDRSGINTEVVLNRKRLKKYFRKNPDAVERLRVERPTPTTPRSAERRDLWDLAAPYPDSGGALIRDRQGTVIASDLPNIPSTYHWYPQTRPVRASKTVGVPGISVSKEVPSREEYPKGFVRLRPYTLFTKLRNLS